MKRLYYALPIVPFLILLVFLGYDHFNSRQGNVKSLVGQKPPEFTLSPLLEGVPSFDSSDLNGKVILVHFFATTCSGCEEEHTILMKLRHDHNIAIYGINFVDPDDQVGVWLKQHGNPFMRLGKDESGRVGMDWGVVTLPETYIISPNGHVAYRHIGPLTPTIVKTFILKEIEQLSLH